VTFDAAWLRNGVVLDLSHRVVLLLHTVTALQEYLGAAPMSDETIDIVGASDCLQRVLWEVRSVADLPMPVLLRGETGSGKELVARAIHQLSARRREPFVPVNLGAIPPSLAPSMLFGAELGAYTGAVKRQAGYFEQARGGTLFLDEIGEAPVEVQAALLRVLETGEMQTLGARGTPKTSARVIAATDADLKGKVDAGTFRMPLLNRLSAYEIWVPSLRERRDDIGRLLVHFLREELGRINELHRLKPPEEREDPWLPASLVARLAEYDWPGNVRQLRSVMQQLVIGNRGKARVELTPAVKRLLDESDSCSPPPVESSLQEAPAPGVDVLAPPAVAALAPATAEPSDEGSLKPDASSRKPANVTEAELWEALHASRWNYEDAAKLLGISRASIYVLIDRLPGFRTAGSLTSEEITRCYHECGGDIAKMADKLKVSERALARRVKELGLKPKKPKKPN
jgi:two-component system nitrogen regulation response regulator GlnG